ncbi:c-type cytochrome [Mucilaginibacter sp.]
MKKVFIILAISSVFAACGGNKSGSDGQDSTQSSNSTGEYQSGGNDDSTLRKDGTTNPGTGQSEPTDPGAQLIAKSDCLGCHKEHDKLVGPAYADVAKKYKESDTQMLAEHIIKGGAGHWGDVAMTAHPNLSVDSAKLMVKYILTVK